VASCELLVMDELGASLFDLVSGPLCVGWITEVIGSTYEHSHRDVRHRRQIDKWWLILVVLLLVEFFGTPIVKLELLAFDYLSVVEEALHASTSWEVAHVDLEPLGVIKLWVLCDEESLCKLA